MVGGTYDMKDWFRQVVVRGDERWKGSYRSGKRTAENHRLQIGGVAAASIAHRLGMLLVVLLLEDIDRALADEWVDGVIRASQSRWGVDLSGK